MCPTKVCPILAFIRISLVLFEPVCKRKAPDGNQGLYRLSERRGSNSRHPPWQGGALPAELLSQILIINYIVNNRK